MLRLFLILPILLVASLGCQQNKSTTSNASTASSTEASQPPASSAAPSAATRTTASGLQIQDLQIGTGTEAVTGKQVSMHYTGTLTDGTKVDSSVGGSPYTLTLGGGEVIAGWDEGIVGMRVGGKRRLTIPPSLGYGAPGRPPVVPPNATLVFDLELMDVK